MTDCALTLLQVLGRNAALAPCARHCYQAPQCTHMVRVQVVFVINMHLWQSLLSCATALARRTQQRPGRAGSGKCCSIFLAPCIAQLMPPNSQHQLPAWLLPTAAEFITSKVCTKLLLSQNQMTTNQATAAAAASCCPTHVPLYLLLLLLAPQPS